MKIEFNNPKVCEQRANVKPLSLKEENEAVALINEMISRSRGHHEPEKFNLIQRLIWNYENLQHFAHVNGYYSDKPDYVSNSELVLNILQQVEIGTSNSGNPCIKDIDEVVDKIEDIFR